MGVSPFRWPCCPSDGGGLPVSRSVGFSVEPVRLEYGNALEQRALGRNRQFCFGVLEPEGVVITVDHADVCCGLRQY